MEVLGEEDLAKIKKWLESNSVANSVGYNSLLSRMIKDKAAIVICGPTCVGKSKIGLNLARILDTDIISVDSMQVYRGMNIGTDKCNTEKYGIKQYMVDIFNPDHYVTVVEFRNICREIIEKEFFLKDRIPLLVGGSGLYIRGVIDNLGFVPKSDFSIRKRLKEEIRNHGLSTLYERLREVDPIYSEKIGKSDERRIIRALEVYEITGRPYSCFQNTWNDRRSIYNVIFLGFSVDRVKLYRNIEERVDRMFKKGL
ncbi:MAG: tRNA (adenosine(37)-N6)-dimethylallyltransferase MiaA, partial [Actinobacteria bacterium]|nr:tRNA (adenosine(37)-N6)-dimethylallyltransferase MiaA [Actinomycetota bacterium]